jgi:L-threonylcarbamoyladenylate synthase
MIETTVDALRQKKIILYPTDTVWGIGGDATDSKVVQKVYHLKQREDHKAMIILLASKEMLEFYVDSIPNQAASFLEGDRPTTVIYPKGVGLAHNLMGEDSSIGIRIPKHSFCQELIKQFGKPIISTSANISGKPTPLSFESINTEILDGVDYIVPLREKTSTQPSRVVKINSKGEIHILRP